MSFIYMQEDIEKTNNQEEEILYGDVCQIIDGVRDRIATYLNTEICMTNWYVGKRIKEDVFYNQRAEYGKQVLKKLSVRLTERYGRGWGYEKLKHCVRSAYLFTEDEIRYATRTQLNWTHLRSLMGIKDPLERQFYAQMCSMEHWDTRTLDEKIDKQLYQRTALSRKPEELIKKELEEQDVWKFLVKGQQPIILVLARSMYRHVPPELLPLLNEGRLLIISTSSSFRQSKATAFARNRYICDIADDILFIGATGSSSLAPLVEEYAEKEVKLSE